MNIRAVLEETGLSEGETTVYLSLLKKGELAASAIAKETKLHRTTVYDFLEKLQEKILVTHTIKNGVKHFEATPPQRFIDLLEDRQDKVRTILPTLESLRQKTDEHLSVEVLSGKQGFIAIWNDLLRAKEDYVVLGSADEKYANMLGETANRYLQKEAQLGMKCKILIHRDESKTFDFPHLEYRYLPKDTPILTSAIIYGNKVGIHLFEPMTTILVENENFATSYRNYFRLLWEQADTAK